MSGNPASSWVVCRNELAALGSGPISQYLVFLLPESCVSQCHLTLMLHAVLLSPAGWGMSMEHSILVPFAFSFFRLQLTSGITFY